MSISKPQSAAHPALELDCLPAKPILKWAGGKTQMLEVLLAKVDQALAQGAPTKRIRRYFEPFFGGGALFFALASRGQFLSHAHAETRDSLPRQQLQSYLSDTNPELINLYQVVANQVEDLIAKLGEFVNDKDFFYQVRSWDFTTLDPVTAAARTLYLNKTCFNGLFRVNKKGHFNVPFADYKNPTICDPVALRAASRHLQQAKIELADYYDFVSEQAQAGDFVFFDPPYVPVGQYADFKRYTKEQFNLADHQRLAQLVDDLVARGVYVLLTNSDTELVRQLYAKYELEAHATKRRINKQASGRTGVDLLVTAFPSKAKATKPESAKTTSAKTTSAKTLKTAASAEANFEQQELQIAKFPRTRFMGSKQKLLNQIWQVVQEFEANTVLDAFGGSNVVGYMLKARGKQVISNDYLHMSTCLAQALIANQSTTLDLATAESLCAPTTNDAFVSKTFAGLYFSAQDNELIDNIRANIKALANSSATGRAKAKHQAQANLALAALIRACTKKRPRGIFTYVGDRYNDGRLDLQKSLKQHFLEAVESLNQAVFTGPKCQAVNGDLFSLSKKLLAKVDLVYLDPPYYTPKSDNEYVRRYHFLEGLARGWQGVEIQAQTKTKKFANYPSGFSTKQGAYEAFARMFAKFSDKVIVLSYSSNSLPTKDELLTMLQAHKTNVKVIELDYRYSIGNHKQTPRNQVQEYLFVAW